MDKEETIQKKKISHSLPFVNKVIIALTLISFSLPFIMNILGLPPYVGSLLGLGLVWVVIHFLDKY